MISGAKVLRNIGEEVEVDLTGYDTKFVKIQYMRTYNDEIAAEGGN